MTKEKIKSKPDVLTHVREPKTKRSGAALLSLLDMFLYYVAGFFFCGAKLPLSAEVLGVSLLCAVSKGAIGVLAGILTRAVTEYIFAKEITFLVYAGSAVLSCVVRYIFGLAIWNVKEKTRYPVLQDSLPSRAALAGIATLSVSLGFLAFQRFTTEKLLAIAFSTVCAAGFAFLFGFVFEKNYKYTAFFDAGIGAVLFATVLSLADITVGGIPLAVAVGFAATLYIAYYGQASRGCAVGLLVGIACGGIYIPLFAVAGLAAGAFFRVGTLAGSLISLCVFLCGGVLTTGLENIWAYLPAIVIGAGFVTIPALLDVLPNLHLFPEEGEKDLALELVKAHRDEENARRLGALSATMSSLAEVLRTLSEAFCTPDRGQVEKMCRDIWKSRCATCGKECSSLKLCGGEGAFFTRFTEKLMASGRLRLDEIAEFVQSDCPHLESIVEKINACAAKMVGEAIAQDKSALFSADYDATAQMLADTVAYTERNFAPDRILTDKLRRTLLCMGLAAENLVVCGDRKKYIVICGGELVHAPVGTDDIKKVCERICKCEMNEPEYTVENGVTALMMESACRFEAEYAGRQIPKADESCCGDSISILQNRDGYFYAFLCDGMGSGREAEMTARICRVFLEKMLACGNKKSTSLEMLNSIVLNKGVECYATVDLLEIDLMQGIASFIKSGATPSYVIRDKHLFKITSATSPIGIMPDIHAEMTEFELRDGDVIVLSSDGISCDEAIMNTDDTAWFAEMLAQEDTQDLSALADKIIRHAEMHCARRDDMTVELIRIHAVEYKENKESGGEENRETVVA